MKLTYKRIKSKSSLIKTATGLSQKEFEYLKTSFEQEWNRYIKQYTFEGKTRKRNRKPRVNNTFKSIADKLVFILFEYRHNMTQEFMGLEFGLTQPQVAAWIKVLEPILVRSLKKSGVSPTRDSEGFNQEIVESVTILLDGSERPINRPKYEQQEYYSGKKSTIR